jgi:hypothetical protein
MAPGWNERTASVHHSEIMIMINNLSLYNK